MYTRIYWIEQFPNGAALGIMPRPRGHDWLEDEIRQLKARQVKSVVSLLERQEAEELGLAAEASLCREQNLDFIQLPIPDRGLPADPKAVQELVHSLHKRIEHGEKIVIHCRMGIGRSAIIAGAVLWQTGLTADDLLEKISRLRELQVPDTEEQRDWLARWHP